MITNIAEDMYKEAYKKHYKIQPAAARYKVYILTSNEYFKCVLLLAKLLEKTFDDFKI